LFPDPNQAILTGTTPTGDYFYNTSGGLVNDQGDGRVDINQNTKYTREKNGPAF